MPNGSVLTAELGDFLSRPMPFPYEVAAWFEAYARVEEVNTLMAEFKDQAETLKRLRRLLGGRLPTDGTYDVSFIAGGDLVQQINEGLQAMASDIHRRSGISEARKLTVNVKAEPSENSAAVKWGYEVKATLAKAEGGGVAYLDKAGRLCAPATAEQVMLQLEISDPKRAA